jgi:pentatricopeptide repeat protein
MIFAFVQVWDLAKRNNGVTLDHYNTLLQVQMDNFGSVNPIQFLTDMTVEPDKNTYSLLLNGAAKAGNSKHVWDIISVIKEKGIVFDEDMFNTLVQIYANNNNIGEAERLITLMRDIKLPVTEAYTELACGSAKFSDIQNLIKILNDEPQSDANLLRIIKILSLSDNYWFIPIVLNFLTIPLSTDKISKTIAELVHAEQIAGATTIINYFKLNDATNDIARSFVNSFLNELIRIQAPAANIVKHAINFMDCEPLALSNVAEIALKLHRQDLCNKIFYAMRDNGIKVQPHYYWPILAAAHLNKGEVEVFSILQSMKNANVEIDFDTLVYHVYPYINTANPHVTLQKMRTHMSDSIVFSPLVAFLLSNCRLQDAINLCERANRKIYYKKLIKPMTHAYFVTRDIRKCVRLLTMYPYSQSYVSMFLKMMLKDRSLNSHVDDLQLALIEFMKHNVKIMRRDANYLKNKIEKHLDTANSTKISNSIENLVDDQLKSSALSIDIEYMDIEDMECFLVEVKNKNYPVKQVLRKLFKAYCDENKFEKAEMMKRELDACGYKWTFGMKMHLFELYVKRDQLDYARIILSDISNTTFKIDKVKILTYAIALVKANKPTEAFQVIKEIKNVKTNSNIQNLCHNLLDTLARSQYHDQTENMLKLLIERDYCVVSLDLLRPLVMIPLKQNDIPRTMETFRIYAIKYRKIPLVLEILTALLQRRDDLNLADVYINQIYKLITDLRDVNVANTTLAMALAILNKTEELQNMLQVIEIFLIYGFA